MLRLMKLLTGNVSRTIDQLAREMHITPRTVFRMTGTLRWTVVHSNGGGGRFVIRLAADVKILEGERLREYVSEYDKRYIKKI